MKNKLTQIGVKVFKEIKAVSMIEDWFLFDKDGIVKFLKLKKCSSLKGKSGLEKVKALFKAGNKIYQKGNYSHKFIPFLDFEKLTNSLHNELKDLEDAIGYVKEDKS